MSLRFLHLAAPMSCLAAIAGWGIAVSRAAESGPAPKIPTKRPPYAEEVGPPPGGKGLRSIAPLPGLPLDTSFDNVSWVDEGPGPTTNGDLNIAPGHHTAGCVTAVVPHPTNTSILYIGTANGGVWKTTNATAASPRWKPLTDAELSLSIGGMARDLSDASGNTLVAGFGRRSSFGGSGGAHKGLIRTTDGGANWTRIGETALAGRSIYQIVVRGSTFLLAVTGTDNSTAAGLYRTTDGGTNFTNISGFAGSGLPAGSLTHLAHDPSNAARYYVHVGGNGVYRSVDSGATWTNISAGMAAANVGQLALTVAFDGTLFAAELTTTSRVYRSTNQGGAWTQMDSVQANTDGLFNGFVADPANNNLVYLSGLYTRGNFPYSGRVVRGNASLAAGSQWASIASTGDTGVGTAPHTDSRALAFNAANRLIEGDDGGIYELSVANVGIEGNGAGGGGTWRSLNGDLHVSEMHSMAYDRVSRIVIGGAQDTGFQEQLVSGQRTWNKTSNGDGGDTAVDFLTTAGQAIRYGSSQFLGGFYRNTYNANNIQTASAGPPTTLVGAGTAIIRGGDFNNMPFVTPLGMNAVAGGRLIIGGNSVVYESTNQGDSVTQIDANALNQLTKIAYGGKLAGVNVPGVLFYGSGANIRYRTAASGAVTSSIAFPGSTVQGVVFDPENWKRAYILGNTTVYTANDIPANGAAAFTNITGNLTGVGTMQTLDYVTLPSGNAIVVGTDLGAYIMRVASPGVWKTLGDNLPHAPVYDSHFDAAGQVLVVTCFGRGSWLYDFKPTKADGQYGETFQSLSENTTVLPARTGEFFSNQLGAPAAVRDDRYRELQLTAEGVGNTLTAFRLPDLNPGKPVPAFSAKWNATIYGDTFFENQLADGFSFSFGPLGGITATNFTNLTYANEDGFNAGLTVSVRTYDGNTPGYYVRVNGAVVPGGFISKPSSSWGDFNPARHLFEVDWRLGVGLTLRVDGVAIFTNLPTPGFIPASGDRFVFGARTGGASQDTRLDNIAIFTGGVLSPLTGGSLYQFSGEFPANGQTADKAFDGNVATKWLTQDYTGFIGASFPTAKTVRAYTLISAEDVPGRDPVEWDFQTGNDGQLWVQRGVQGAQHFVNRNESRNFVVANPAANSKFRMLIGNNDEAPEIQLAEFQPWELTPVAPAFIITNTNDSGVGSLRAALIAAATFDSPSTITFAANLSGGTITLTSGPLALSASPGVTVDASALAAGLTISGNSASRLFTIAPASSLTLKNLTLIGGNTSGAFPLSYGGAILTQSPVTLTDCTLSGNTSSLAGGAIFNQGSTLTLLRCTLSGNATSFGGAIQNEGTLNATSSTFANNTAPSQGGAISSPGASTVTLVHCTVTANSSGTGGGIIGNNIALNNSIVAGNTAPSGADISGSFTQTGANLVGGSPLLAPLDNYGGLTKTVALIAGSPARNTSVGSTAIGDQRGFPIVGNADIGAYEAGTFSVFNAWIWELLPNGATIAQHAGAADYDGDSANNLSEWLARTNPADPTSILRLIATGLSGSNLNFHFNSVLGRNYTLEYTTDFVTWIPVGTFPGTGGEIFNAIGPVSFPKEFIRLRVGP